MPAPDDEARNLVENLEMPGLEDLAQKPPAIAAARQELVAAERYLEELVGVEIAARFALQQLPSMLREARRNLQEKQEKLDEEINKRN